jgi:type II secretory ATPase GspE/PulE/Tfp pilus assembly ATPase PilB-like protein
MVVQKEQRNGRDGQRPALELPEAEHSAPEILKQLIDQAERAGASDVHLHMRDDAALVTFRLDGVMTPTTVLPQDVAERVFGRIKFLARLKTYQDSLPQDGRIDKGTLQARSDIRVSTYPTITGEKIVLRLFDTAEVRTLEQLGFAASLESELVRFLRRTFGLLLLTGPAGSGKTTTIYACLRHLAATGGRHIITVEDPAEQVIDGVMQTEVNEARGLDFAKAARHLLRQDPQVLVIGEIRDEETANLALRAALTGHLVISTLHAGSCQGVFERLLVLCRDHSAIASSVELVLNQRLLRRLCRHCFGNGCPDCLETGYRGRLPLVESLRLNDALRRDLAQARVENLAAHPSLNESARGLVESELTNQAEVDRVLGIAQSGPE